MSGNKNADMSKASNTLPKELDNFIKSLPKEKQLQAKTALISIERKYTSPLPPSEEMQVYENLNPGTTEKFVEMVVNANLHRLNTENKIVDKTLKLSSRGQMFAFILCIIILIFAVILALKGHDWLGGIFAFFTIAIVLASFVLNKESNVTQR